LMIISRMLRVENEKSQRQRKAQRPTHRGVREEFEICWPLKLRSHPKKIPSGGRPDKQSNKRKVPGALPLRPPPLSWLVGGVAEVPILSWPLGTQRFEARSSADAPSATGSDSRFPNLRLRDRAYSSHERGVSCCVQQA
jgi:hypothetical protein